jgi:hypothetical protein
VAALLAETPRAATVDTGSATKVKKTGGVARAILGVLPWPKLTVLPWPRLAVLLYPIQAVFLYDLGWWC